MLIENIYSFRLRIFGRTWTVLPITVGLIEKSISRVRVRRGVFWKFPNKSKVDLRDYRLAEFRLSKLGPVQIMDL